MLPKNRRLTTAAFDTAFAASRRTHGQYVQVLTSPSTEFHAAVVVGKKVSKRAVDRNKIRRRLYSVLYHWYTKQDQVAGQTYIVLTKPTAKGVPYQSLREDLRALLDKR